MVGTAYLEDSLLDDLRVNGGTLVSVVVTQLENGESMFWRTEEDWFPDLVPSLPTQAC